MSLKVAVRSFFTFTLVKFVVLSAKLLFTPALVSLSVSIEPALKRIAGAGGDESVATLLAGHAHARPGRG